MPDAKRKLTIATVILVAGCCIGLLAFNVRTLWIVWLLTVGFFVGSALAPRMSGIAISTCLVATFAIAATLCIRMAPVFSLNWSGADRVEISRLVGDWKIVLTNPDDIAALMSYGESGHRESMMKSGSTIHMFVTHDHTTTGYYVHGDTVGPSPGGFMQTVFVPQRQGLGAHLNDLITQHGHGESEP